ncbi:MAG: hypothetical protein KDD38_08365, partial [Bdellovibrionales bacterium]|nr:hypothetical protein [Bdellovibrionales bacterium]
MRKFLVTGLVLFSSLLHAADSGSTDFNLDEIPPLKPIKLLVSEANPYLHILLAREEKGSNHYLLIHEFGKISVPRQKENSMIYYDGGTADLYLESGERILIPADRQHNYLNTSLGATIMYPNQAPHPLQTVKITKAKLKELGFAKFMAAQPKTVNKNHPQDWEAYQPLSDPKTMVLVEVQLKEKLSYEAMKKIEDDLKQLDPNKVRFIQRGDFSLDGNSKLYLLAAPDATKLISSQIPPEHLVSLQIFNPNLITYKNQIAHASRISKDVQDLNDKTLPLQVRATTLLELSTVSPWINTTLSHSGKIELIRGVIRTLGELDQVHALVHDLVKYETAVQSLKSGNAYSKFSFGTKDNMLLSENHALKTSLLEPIRKLGAAGYEVLHNTNHPIAREAIVETANAIYGAGLPFFNR